MLDDGDVELPRQAEEGHGREEQVTIQVSGEPSRVSCVGDGGLFAELPPGRTGRRTERTARTAPTVSSAISFCDRFEGDCQHHAAMLLGRLHVAHAGTGS